ncbi:MAG: PAS domain-containing protein, partial [Myxococcota bacterium]
MIAPASNLDAWIRERLFAAVPVGIAIIDEAYDVVYANPAFERMFGPWKGRKCYAVYKDRDTICPHCQGGATFRDGKPRISEEVGYSQDGRVARYIKHTFPIVDEEGTIPYLVEMSTDTTDIEWLRQEHQALFDQVPCNVSLIDRDLRVVRANRRILEKFGQVEGRYCFEVFKGLDGKCTECPAQRTFNDGEVHTGHSLVHARDGRPVHFQVTTAPLSIAGGRPDLVMEMAVDVTKTLKLEDDLRIAHAFMEKLIAT